jgi:hypothetical protein
LHFGTSKASKVSTWKLKLAACVGVCTFVPVKQEKQVPRSSSLLHASVFVLLYK